MLLYSRAGSATVPEQGLCSPGYCCPVSSGQEGQESHGSPSQTCFSAPPLHSMAHYSHPSPGQLPLYILGPLCGSTWTLSCTTVRLMAVSQSHAPCTCLCIVLVLLCWSVEEWGDPTTRFFLCLSKTAFHWPLKWFGGRGKLKRDGLDFLIFFNQFQHLH